MATWVATSWPAGSAAERRIYLHLGFYDSLINSRPDRREFALNRGKLSTIGQRFEQSRLGEFTISVVVALALTIGVVWSMPDAEFKRRLVPVLQPIAVATGLEQDWRMYAPEPLARLESVEVRVTMTNGVQRVWTPPRGDRVLGAFAWYHWQKLKENLVREPAIRADMAHWVIHQVTGHSEHAARVQMVLRTELLPAPGTDSPRTVAEEILYDEILTGRQ